MNVNSLQGNFGPLNNSPYKMTGAPFSPANDPAPAAASDSFVAATPQLDNLVGNQVPVGELKQVVNLIAQSKPLPYEKFIIKGQHGNDQDATVEALAGDLKPYGVKTFTIKGNTLALETGAAGIDDALKEAKDAADASPARTAMVFIRDLDLAFPIRQQSNSPEPTHSNRLLGRFVDRAEELHFDNGSRLILMGTTSNINAIDSSAYQAFDRTLESRIPENPAERLQLLNGLVKDKGYNLSPEANLGELAENTGGANPLKLSSILKTSAILADGKPVTTANLREATLRDSYGAPVPMTNPDWMFRLSALHELGHTVTRDFFEQMATPNHPDQLPQAIALISLVPREGTTASVQLKLSPNPAKTFEYYIAEMCSNLGGRASESIFGDGHMSAGPGSDIRSATSGAKEAVTQMGMGKTVGAMQPDQTGISSAYTDAVKTDEENLLKASEQLAVNIITFYKPFMEGLADEMVANKNNPDKLIMSGDEFHKKLTDWQNADPSRTTQFNDLAASARATMASLKPSIPGPSQPPY